MAGNALPPTQTTYGQKWLALWLALCFVLGFSTVFILLGATATALGQSLMPYRHEANIVGGIIVTVFGLFTAGILKLSWLERDIRFHGNIRGARPVAAYLLGLAFAFGWTPCIGPVLGAILTVSAASATASTGIALLSAYSVGLGVPFLGIAVFTAAFLRRLPAIRSVGRWLQLIAGAVMILMGLAMITGQFQAFALWLLDVFPSLGGIG